MLSTTKASGKRNLSHGGGQMHATLDAATEHEYLELVRTFPLISIRDDEHLEEALQVIDRLVDNPSRSEAEEAYLGALSDIVEIYENAHVIFPPVSGLEALQYLVEENGLTADELAPLFGSVSIVSEVLAGTRPLTLTYIGWLADYFGVPADVFIDRVGTTEPAQEQ